MSGTRRTPTGRLHKPSITPRAIELFKQLKRCRCSCAPGQRFECPGCKRREALDEQIGLECGTPVWQYPCLERPGAQNPYPPGHANYQWWQERDRAPEELWEALKCAAAARRASSEAAE